MVHGPSFTLSRIHLASPRTTATPTGVTVRGHGIQLSASQETRNVNFDLEVEPVAHSKLSTVNGILNSYSRFIGPRIKKRASAFVGFTLTHQVPRNKLRLDKYVVPSQLRKLQASVGAKLMPDSLWFSAQTQSQRRSITVTHYLGYDVIQSILFDALDDHIPKNIIVKNYKLLQKMLNQGLRVVKAK